MMAETVNWGAWTCLRRCSKELWMLFRVLFTEYIGGALHPLRCWVDLVTYYLNVYLFTPSSGAWQVFFSVILLVSSFIVDFAEPGIDCSCIVLIYMFLECFNTFRVVVVMGVTLHTLWRLMLYTRLAVCLDISKVVVTRMAVHAMISHNCLRMIYSATLPWCFFLNKWKCCEIKHIIWVQNTKKDMK